jgi:hypothetical protein
MTVKAAARRLIIGLYKAEIEDGGLPRPLRAQAGEVFRWEAMNDLAEAIWNSTRQ